MGSKKGAGVCIIIGVAFQPKTCTLGSEARHRAINFLAYKSYGTGSVGYQGRKMVMLRGEKREGARGQDYHFDYGFLAWFANL